MSSPIQTEMRWQYVLGQAFLAASASVLFITTKSAWFIFGVDFFVILGIAFFIFSLILMVSALGVVVKKLGKFLSWVEGATNWLWFTFMLIDIAAIISNWAVGKSKIEQLSWLSSPYDWSVPLWLILFTAILIVLGFSPIVIRFRQDWRLATRQYSLFLAFAFALLALTGVHLDVFTTNWILSFHILTLVLIGVRIAVK